MARTSDTSRIITKLAAFPQGLSNRRIKTDLNLADERYETLRKELIEAGEVEKYVCRGGGLRLTAKGDSEAETSEMEEAQGVRSSVAKEQALYPILIETLRREAPEDVIIDTGALRKRGKWQNPDVTQVSVQVYPRLRKKDILVSTYEVKQWNAWDVTAVFEAASHRRMAHESWVVLEWPTAAAAVVPDDSRIENLLRECRRFRIGLATLQPYYSMYRFHPQVEPEQNAPADEDVEGWLDYALERVEGAEAAFDKLIRTADDGMTRKPSS